jgi:hypothetical protein
MSVLPLRRGELLDPTTSEGWAVYEPESDSLHVLNDSARAIWELCDGETSPAEMAEAISELTGLDSQDAIHDVESTLSLLRGLGLVVG